MARWDKGKKTKETKKLNIKRGKTIYLKNKKLKCFEQGMKKGDGGV